MALCKARAPWAVLRTARGTGWVGVVSNVMKQGSLMEEHESSKLRSEGSNPFPANKHKLA